MKQTFTVTPQQAHQRIDALASHLFPGLSRSRWAKQGVFKCNTIAKAAKTKVKPGEIWEVSCDTTTTKSTLQPWDYPLEILAKTSQWAVINKPYGISVHPSISDPSQETIVNALLSHFGTNLAPNQEEIDGQVVDRPGLVHRLDKTTDGILLIAKTTKAHRFLQENWKDCQKIYEAWVRGNPPLEGRIESGISRHPHQRQKMTATHDPTAKWAETSFERLEVTGGQTKLRVQIYTGRTHQIRVHLSSIGFPIIGDRLYGGEEASRVMLRAVELTFPDPETKKSVTVKVPGL